MPITTDNPITQPAVPAITYDEIWIRSFTVQLGGCNGEPAILNATFGLVGRDANGVGSFLPDFNRTWSVPDVFAIDDSSWVTLLEDVVGELISKASAAGVLNTVVPESSSSEGSQS